MMKLYFDPQSRAAVARWMLDEAQAPYELVPTLLREQAHKAPEFLRINPAGKLPALVDGQARVFENAAIALYVADRYAPGRLAPLPDDPARGRYLSLMVYSTAQLEPAMGDHLLGLASDNRSRGWTDFAHCLQVVEQELGAGPWLFGDWFTAADVMIGSMFLWMRMWGRRTDNAAVDAYADRLLQRPFAIRPPG